MPVPTEIVFLDDQLIQKIKSTQLAKVHTARNSVPEWVNGDKMTMLTMRAMTFDTALPICPQFSKVARELDAIAEAAWIRETIADALYPASYIVEWTAPSYGPRLRKIFISRLAYHARHLTRTWTKDCLLASVKIVNEEIAKQLTERN